MTEGLSVSSGIVAKAGVAAIKSNRRVRVRLTFPIPFLTIAVIIGADFSLMRSFGKCAAHSVLCGSNDVRRVDPVASSHGSPRIFEREPSRVSRHRAAFHTLINAA